MLHLVRSRFQLSQELCLHPLIKRIQHGPVLQVLSRKWSQHAHGSIKVVHLQNSGTMFHPSADRRGQQFKRWASTCLRANKVARPGAVIRLPGECIEQLAWEAFCRIGVPSTAGVAACSPHQSNQEPAAWCTSSSSKACAACGSLVTNEGEGARLDTPVPSAALLLDHGTP